MIKNLKNYIRAGKQVNQLQNKLYNLEKKVDNLKALNDEICDYSFSLCEAMMEICPEHAERIFYSAKQKKENKDLKPVIKHLEGCLEASS